MQALYIPRHTTAPGFSHTKIPIASYGDFASIPTALHRTLHISLLRRCQPHTTRYAQTLRLPALRQQLHQEFPDPLGGRNG